MALCWSMNVERGAGEREQDTITDHSILCFVAPSYSYEPFDIGSRDAADQEKTKTERERRTGRIKEEGAAQTREGHSSCGEHSKSGR